MTSNGHVYQFREGKENGEVTFTRHDTKLGKECEFEGLVIDPSSGEYILACKNIKRKSMRDQLLIYRWAPKPGGGHSVSTLGIPLADVIAGNGWKSFSPSDIAIDPSSGNYVIISGPEKGLVEVTPAGQVVRSTPLPGNPQQPEGIAITADGILMIADEGVTRAADVTLYRWRPAAEAPDGVADTTAATQPTVQ
jgi:hypothetical protein